eukprot:1048591-Rhodomonas_salina.1
MADQSTKKEPFHLFDSEADMQGVLAKKNKAKKMSFHLFDTETELPPAVVAGEVDPAALRGESSDPDVEDLFAIKAMDTEQSDDADEAKEAAAAAAADAKAKAEKEAK